MDLKTSAVNALKGACQMIQKDLEALPDDAFDKCLGGKARTVADMIYEVNLVNEHVGMVIRGEEAFEWPEGWITAPEDFRTKDAVISGFEKTYSRIVSTAESFSPELFEEPIEIDGQETTRFERCRFMTLHMWYHSGQLNFIQTLLGDDGWHW